MTKVLTVFSAKGGAGKSTAAANLAAVARCAGASVGLIDVDPQQSLLAWSRLRPLADVPARACNAAALRRTIDRERERGVLEYVIVDTPPTVNPESLAGLRAADLVLVPVRAASFDLSATHATFELIRSLNKGFAAFINCAPPRRENQDAPLVRETRAALAPVGRKLWARQITQRVAIVYAAASGLGANEYEPGGPSAIEYERLWADLKLGSGDLRTAA